MDLVRVSVCPSANGVHSQWQPENPTKVDSGRLESCPAMSEDDGGTG